MLPLSETGVVEGDGGVIPFCSTIIGEETVGGVGDVASGRDGGSVAEVASDGGSGGAVTSISLPSLLLLLLLLLTPRSVVDSFSLSEFTSFSANVARCNGIEWGRK